MYNEFDVASPVVKRVQYLVRKARDVIDKTRESEVRPVMNKEIEVDTSESSTPAADETMSDFLRQLLRSDSFLSSDVQKIPTETTEFRDSASQSSFADSSTKSTTKKKTKMKKTESVDVETASATVLETSNAVSEVSSSATSNKEVKTVTRKNKTDRHVDSASTDTVTASSTAEPPVSEAKPRSRRRQTKSTVQSS